MVCLVAGHSQLYPLHWQEGQPPPVHTSAVTLPPDVQSPSAPLSPAATAAGVVFTPPPMYLVSSTEPDIQPRSQAAEDRLATGLVQPSKLAKVLLSLRRHPPPPPGGPCCLIAYHSLM